MKYFFLKKPRLKPATAHFYYNDALLVIEDYKIFIWKQTFFK